MKEAIEEIGNAKIAQLLALVGHIVVLDTKGSRNGSVLDCGSDEDREGAGGDLADQVAGRSGRGFLATGIDFDDCEKIVVRGQVVVHSVANTCVEKQCKECSCDGEQPDDLVLVSPLLARLVENREEQDRCEADGAGDNAGCG